jgi:putative ABC transport system permease protein
VAAILRLALSGLRGRGRTAAAVTVLVSALAAASIVAGLSVQGLGGPRIDRIHDEDGRPDLVVFGEPDALRAVSTDPAFAATGPVTPFVEAEVPLADDTVDARVAALQPASGSAVGRPLLRSGRWPASGNGREVVFDQAAAVAAGIRLGDEVRLRSGARSVPLTVVGTAVDLTDCFYPDCDPIRLFVDPAALPIITADPTDQGAMLIARLNDPATADAAAARLVARPGVRGTETWPDTRGDILIREQIFGAFLAAFGLFVLLAAAFVVAGAATARLVARRREIAMLQAVGYTGRQIIAGLVTQTLLLGAVGVLVGWVAGTLLAPSLQVGLAGALGRSGARVALLPLVAAALVVGLILAAATVLPARAAARTPVSSVLRDVPTGVAAPSRVARALDRTRLAPAYRYGLSAVLARPGRSALTAGALAIAVAATMVAIGFVSTLDKAVSDPSALGTPYDVIVTPGDTPATQVSAALAATPGVSGWFTQTDHRSTLGDETFLSRSIGGDPEQAGFVVREGRGLRAPGEALAGYGFLRRFGVEVGDTVQIRAGDTPLTLTIVGWYSATEDTGEILLYRAEMLAPAPPEAYLVSARTGTLPGTLATALRGRLGPDAAVHVRESSQDLLGVFTTAIELMAALILVVSLANLAAALLSGARERARILGVLRTVGFTVRQTLAQSAAGGAALGLVAGLVGLPVGVLAYYALADQTTSGIGAGPGFAERPSALLLVAAIPVAMLVSALAGVLVTRRLARTPAADLVRWE